MGRVEMAYDHTVDAHPSGHSLYLCTQLRRVIQEHTVYCDAVDARKQRGPNAHCATASPLPALRAEGSLRSATFTPHQARTE